MANAQIGNNQGFAAASLGSGAGNRSNLNGADVSAQAALDMDNLDNIAAMRTRLAAISGTTYTAAYLDAMTMNDMQYAIRVNDFASTIKQ